ncbi:hypothetical protein A2U01_0087121, partial [Trifolium medium]|nr:hypothetical protein [Trifolium medium]
MYLPFTLLLDVPPDVATLVTTSVSGASFLERLINKLTCVLSGSTNI